MFDQIRSERHGSFAGIGFDASNVMRLRVIKAKARHTVQIPNFFINKPADCRIFMPEVVGALFSARERRKKRTIADIFGEKHREERVVGRLHHHHQRGVKIVVILEAEIDNVVNDIPGIMFDRELFAMSVNAQVLIVAESLVDFLHEFGIAGRRIERVDSLASVVQQAEDSRRICSFDQIAHDFVVKVSDVLPFHSFILVFLLLLAQSQIDKDLLQTFIDVIDAELE